MWHGGGGVRILIGQRRFITEPDLSLKHRLGMVQWQDMLNEAVCAIPHIHECKLSLSKDVRG